MATITRFYNSNISSVQSLENRCNFDELNLPGKFQSMKAASNVGGVEATEAVYLELEKPVGVGNLKIAADNSGKDSAWIANNKTSISITRS